MTKERKKSDDVFALDISYSPDVRDLAEEVARTRKAKALKRGDEEIARVVPVAKRSRASTRNHKSLSALAHRLAGSLANVEIPGWESSEAAEHWVETLRQADMYPLESPTRR